MLTILQEAQKAMQDALIDFGGTVRDVKANTGESVRVTVEDVPMLPDPSEIARAQVPVYVNLHCIAGAVRDLRSVSQFQEASGRRYKVLRYNENSANQVNWSWLCEVQRL